MLSSVFLSLSLLPLLGQCARLPHTAFVSHGPNLRLGRDTETQVVTLFQTLTLTTTTTLASTSTSPLSSTVTSTLDGTLPTTSATVDTILFLPPDALSAMSAAFQDSGSLGDKPLVMAYYPDWVESSFPPEKIDFKRFDWIDFAFALPDQNFNLTWDNPDGAPALLRRLVDAAHLASKKVKLSVGGWTGSKYFSPAVATNETRKIFVTNILAIYNEFNLDGIDIDWEYPGHEGDSGNSVASNDSANFLLFLQLLRATLPASARITAATQTSPFVDSHGQPMEDVSEYAKVLDWILLMNYDVWGSSQTPGPNAPMYDACHNSSQPEANAVAAYDSWTSAGFPASKLVLGLPAYGYISTSNATHLRTRSNSRSFSHNHPRSSGNDSEAQEVKVVDEDGGTNGQVQFRELVRQGVLVRNNSSSYNDNNGPVFNAAGGFTRYWDECSSTTYLRSSSVGQVITYDDPESLGMKAAFAKRVGMMGTNMFDIHGDTDQWDLTDSVRSALGRKT